MAHEIDVRRLRLQPGDTLVAVVPTAMNQPQMRDALKSALQLAGHGATPVMVIGGDVSLYTLPASPDGPSG